MTNFKTYFLMVEVFTRVGGFEGRVTPQPMGYDTAVRTRNQLQDKISDMKSLSLFTKDENTEVTFGSGTLKNSVFKFRIVEVLGNNS